MIKMINNKILISSLVIIFGLIVNISFAKVNDLPPVTSSKVAPHTIINEKGVTIGGYVNKIGTGTTSTGSIQTYSFHKDNTGKVNTGIIAQTTLGGGGKNAVIKKTTTKAKVTTTKKSKVVTTIKKKK